MAPLALPTGQLVEDLSGETDLQVFMIHQDAALPDVLVRNHMHLLFEVRSCERAMKGLTVTDLVQVMNAFLGPVLSVHSAAWTASMQAPQRFRACQSALMVVTGSDNSGKVCQEPKGVVS